MKATEILKSKNKMKLLFKFLVFAFVLQSAEAYSWGTTGHRTIAEIAEHHLTNKSKRKLRKILGNQKLSYYANWPDFIKSDSLKRYKETEIWHYVNVSPKVDFINFENELKENKTPNLYSAILKQEAVLRDKNSSKADKKFAVVFLIHLLGDLHQPMHVGRAEDQGGNLVPINFFKETTNLHSLWDTKLIDFQKYSYSEYAIVLDNKSKNEVKKIQSGTLEDWLFESYRKADKIYNQTPINGNYGYEYNYKFSGLMEEQLLEGGLRLAKVLNEVL